MWGMMCVFTEENGKSLRELIDLYDYSENMTWNFVMTKSELMAKGKELYDFINNPESLNLSMFQAMSYRSMLGGFCMKYGNFMEDDFDEIEFLKSISCTEENLMKLGEYYCKKQYGDVKYEDDKVLCFYNDKAVYDMWRDMSEISDNADMEYYGFYMNNDKKKLKDVIWSKSLPTAYILPDGTFAQSEINDKENKWKTSFEEMVKTLSPDLIVNFIDYHF